MSYRFGGPPPPPLLSPPSGDLRERITGRRRSPSRSRSYSPPPPPSHPSRQFASLSRPRSTKRHRSRSGSPRRQYSASVRTRRDRSGSDSRSDWRGESGAMSSSKSEVRAKSRSRTHHRGKSASKTKKSRRRSRTTSSSDSTSDENYNKPQPRTRELRKTIERLLHDCDSMGKERRKRKKKSRTKSEESKSSRDEPTTSVSDEKRLRMTGVGQENPVKPSGEFKPLVVEDDMVVGFKKCRICSTYYPRNEEEESQHLARHHERLFMLTVPSNTYFYDIEEVIKGLARRNFIKTEIEEKVHKYRLLTYPTNLRGYSCDICKKLDTSDENVFLSHMKNECHIDKKERMDHIIYFCRGCQGRFPSREILEEHIAAGPCWPRMMTINRLYDEVAHEAPPGTSDTSDTNTGIKQEQLQAGESGSVPAPGSVRPRVSVKRELMEGGRSTEPSPFITPEPRPPLPLTTPYLSQPDVFPSPVGPGVGDPVWNQFSHPPPPVQPGLSQFSQPPPVIPCPYSLPPPSFPLAGFPMTGLAQPPAKPSPAPLPSRKMPSYSNYGPVLKTEPEPSPSFSPLSSSRRRKESQLAPPPPPPLPSASDLFSDPRARARERSKSPDEIEVLEMLKKSASSVNCSRLLCEWSDPHMENCKRQKLLKRCEARECRPEDLHAIFFRPSVNQTSPSVCQRLSRDCDGKVGNRLMKHIETRCPNSFHADTACKEAASVIMRLLYRRNSKTAKDPRLSCQNYARSSHAARIIRSRARGAQWDVDTIIATWSAVSQIRVRQENNPNLLHEDSDSDIKCLDDN